MKEESNIRDTEKELTLHLGRSIGIGFAPLDKLLQHYVEFQIFAFTKKSMEKYKKEKGKYID